MGLTHGTGFQPPPQEQSGDPGPSQRKWEKSRQRDLSNEPDDHGSKQIVVIMKDEPEEISIPNVRVNLTFSILNFISFYFI